MEPELGRVQALELQVQALMQARALVQVAELARLEPQVQVQVQLELLAQWPLVLEQHLQRSRPKPQLHRHRCKGPDRSQEPQLELRQTQVHPKALDMTPQVLVLALEPQVQQKLALEPQVRQELVLELTQAPELEQVQELAAQLAQEPVQRAQQELLVQEPGSELRVFLARLPLQQDLTRHI